MIENLHTIFTGETVSIFERGDGIDERLSEGFEGLGER